MRESAIQSNGNRRLSGLIFGAFLALVYAYISIEINRSALPDLPLAGPPAGDVGYYLEFLAGGAILGLAACWSERIMLGILIGTVIGTLVFLLLPWQNALAPVPTPGLDPATLLTLVVSLLVLCVGLRMAVENLPTRPGRYQILKQIGWPLIATALVIVFGILASYTQDVRDDFQVTQNLMALAQKSTDASSLPASLQKVNNWFPQAAGDYTLAWSEGTDRLMWQKLGIQPTDTRDHVIVVRFGNNFTIGCVFTSGKTSPDCANFEY